MLSPVAASPSTFVPPGAPQHASILMPIQLTKDNYLLWKSLFIPILKAHDMLNLAEGREQCPPRFDPAYTNWIKRDQIFMTWINASLSTSLVLRYPGLRYPGACTSGRALWLHLENLLAKDATSRVLGLKARLQNLDKRRYGKMKEYLDSAQQIADELEAVGSPVDDGELVCHILAGLVRPPKHYENLVVYIRTRPMPVTRQQLLGLLLSHRSPMDKTKIWICLYRCTAILPPVLFLAMVSLLTYMSIKR